MKIEKISASIKFSQDSNKGSWKTLELSAEGSVSPNESWQAAQAHLYSDLAQQFKTLWKANGIPGPAPVVPQEAPVVPVPAPEPEHWCSVHDREFTAKTGKSGATFYSHREGEGWCNESRLQG